jgi:hypothetical protein
LESVTKAPIVVGATSAAGSPPPFKRTNPTNHSILSWIHLTPSSTSFIIPKGVFLKTSTKIYIHKNITQHITYRYLTYWDST